MKISLSIFILLLLFVSIFGQKVSINLTFTAINNKVYVQLDSIKVMNRSNGEKNKIYWPDTTLSIEITPGDTLLYIGYATGYPAGVHELRTEAEKFQLLQNYPNPVNDYCIISMSIPAKGIVSLNVTDMQGKLINTTELQMQKGNHSFRFTPGVGNFFFITARWNGISRSIKIITICSNSNNLCEIEYIGNEIEESSSKAKPLKNYLVIKESGILDTPNTNVTYVFQFVTNIPCPDSPTVEYEGQVYNTIQIFSQCWLKENLNVGNMIPANHGQSNNDTIEKYCYNNELDSCTKYGGLYQWWEIMQYATQQGVQGICPPGWHLPTDEEWKVLEGAVDTQYGIGDPEWDQYYDRGFDAGANLKTTSGWNYGGNGTDLFDFSGLPGSYRDGLGGFGNVGDGGYWWSSKIGNGSSSWFHFSYYNNPRVDRGTRSREDGISVRCLRNN